MKKLLYIISISLLPTAIAAQQMKTTVFSSGGGNVSSSSYTNFGTFGQPLSTGSTATLISNKEGFIFAQQNSMTVSVSASQTICYNTSPDTVTATISNSEGTPLLQWQVLGSSNWVDIDGATSSFYIPGNLAETAAYRLSADDSQGIGLVISDTVTITVYDELVAGTIAADQTICHGTAPAQLTSNGLTGGNTPYTYQWQNSTDNVNFADIASATQTTLQPGTLTTTTYYRLKQTSASSCGTVFTDTLTITVEPTPVAGTLAKTPDVAEVCEGGDVSAALTAGTGGNGVDSIYYRTKTDGTWTDWIDYTSGSNISTTDVTDVEVLTWRNADYCSDAEGDTVAWIVSPQTGGGAVTGGTLVCYGSNSTLLTLTGHTGTVQKWQYSTDGSSWIDIRSHTATTYTAEDLTEDTYYRAVVASGVCSAVNSDSTQITIKNDFKISGFARYNNNPLTRLSGLKITLKKDGSVVGSPVITSSSGYYEFNNLVSGTYSMEVSSSHPSGNWPTWGGVTNADYLLVSQHVAGSNLLKVDPPVIRVSASVKAPHPLINNTDATAIRQAAKYPVNGWNYFDIPKWVFSGVSTTARIDSIFVGCENVTRDIRGLCAGDVNGTYVPANGYKVAGTGLELVNRGTIGVSYEMTFGLRLVETHGIGTPSVETHGSASHPSAETPPVETHGSASLQMAGTSPQETHDRASLQSGGQTIGAITLFMNYDPKQIEILNITMPENAGNDPWFETDHGVLYIGWISTEPISVIENQPVLFVHARLVETHGSASQQTQKTHSSVETNGRASLQLADPIRFTLNETMVSELADGKGNVIDGVKLAMPGAGEKGEIVKWENGETVNWQNGETVKRQNGEIVCYPNPAQSTLNIEFSTFNLQPSSCNLQLVNLHGVPVLSLPPATVNNGWHKVVMDLRGLVPGVYFLRVSNDGEMFNKKVIITH